MPDLTREQLVQAAVAAAEKVGPNLSRSEFIRVSGITDHQIGRLFPEGRWSEVKRLAGLERNPKHNVPFEDETLLREFHRVASDLGRVPTWAVFAARAQVSADVVRRRFGGLQGTLSAYRDWLEATEPTSPLLEQLQAKSRHEIPIPPSVGASNDVSQPQAWERMDGPVYGAPINFRGLRHAPVNEQGVVFLFGMVAYELGFIVEAVHAAYPDCEAKRCIDQKEQRWQRVRIEFEFRSRTFRDHGHDPNSCDLIVCWEHNWTECPLQVLELRRVLDDLDG